MNYIKRCLVLLILFFFLETCSSAMPYFDGKEICLEKKHYLIFSDNDVPHSIKKNFDDSGLGDGILKIRYGEGDSFYNKIESLWGKPSNSVKNVSLSFSLQQLSRKDILKYQNSPWIRDAYLLEGAYYDAEKEIISHEYVKIADPILRHQWHVFYNRNNGTGYQQDHWLGHCTKYAVGVECTYFTIFDSNYLLKINVPENFIFHREELVSIVKEHIVQDVFCDS